MQCYHCHTPLPDGSRFCLSCGANLSDPSGAGASTTAAMDAAAAEQLLRLVRQEVGGEFEIERELGRGGMAVVYLATEVHLGRKVAIKVLPPDLTFGTGAVERFKREARTAATLDHPNIVPVYRVSPGGRLFWYAMKFLEGQSLADRLKKESRLSLADSVAILEQVASALDYAHARHVIHRDIKPANVMLDAQNRVIVTDFGIAKQLAAGSFTASGSVIGTPYYMSPEQCSGSKTLTGAADQYSVGVMAYQMLSGRVPFEGDSAVDILAKHIMQAPPPLDVLRPGLPGHVYQAVEKALGKKPEERFVSLRAFADALKHPRGPVTVPKARRSSFWRRAPTVTAPGMPQGKPRVRWAVLGLAAVAGGGVGALLLSWPGRGPLVLSRSGSQPESGPPAPAPVDSTPIRVQATPHDTAGPETAATSDTTTRPGSLTAAAPPRTTGRLLIAGLPRGGAVLLNGQRRSGTRFELPPGRYTLGFSVPGYGPVSDTLINVAPGDSAWVAYWGSPIARPGQPVAGTRQTRAGTTQPGAAPVRGAEPASQAFATLVARTVGGWARISVDGSFRREGTSHRDSLAPGRHTLRFERDGYVSVDTTVTLQPGESRMLTVTMTPQAQGQTPVRAQPAAPVTAGRVAPPASMGVLVIRTVGGWARIFVDGALKREGTSHRDSLPSGQHRVRLEREGFLTVDTTVTVRARETQLLTLNMRPGGS